MAIAYTIVTANHLFQARTLMESVAQFWPAARRCVVVIDPSAEAPAQPESFEVIAAERLGLPGFRHHAFLLDAISLCCLLKPIAAQYLCEVFSPELIAYFDGDTCLYAPPQALVNFPANASIILTPHLLAPVPPGLNRSDFNFLLSGVFNAGFFAVRPNPESQRFLSWWRENLDQPGHMRPEWSFDQAWLNPVPLYFSQVRSCEIRDSTSPTGIFTSGR